jgi:hypothetical protein
VCPRCCDKREKSYRFHPEYNRPEGKRVIQETRMDCMCSLLVVLPLSCDSYASDTDSMEKHRRSRQQRARLLKERRRHMAEAAENKSKKRARKPAAPQATANKKPKMDMHDAELFVDRIKVRGTFLNLRVEWVSSQWRVWLMCSIVVIACAAASLRAIPGEVREILANLAGK